MENTFEKQNNDDNQSIKEMDIESNLPSMPVQAKEQREDFETMAEKIYEEDFIKPLAEMMDAELSTKEGGEFVLSDIINEQLSKFQTQEFSTLSSEEQT